MTVAAPKMGPAEWALLCLLALVWGGSFFFAKIAVAEVPPLTVVACRVGLAAAALAIVLRALGNAMPRDLASWRNFAVMGFLNNALPFTLLFWAQITIASGLAAILNATTPLFTALFAQVLTADERLTAGKGLGILLGIAGVAVMIGVDVLENADGSVLAQLACVGAACSYGLASIWGRRFAGTPPMVTACGQLTASSALMIPVAFVLDRPWQLAAPSGGAVAALIALALVSSAFAYILYFRILKAAGSTNVSLVTLLVPVSAILLGAAFLGERLSGEEIAGMALIALGLMAIDGRFFAWARGRRAVP
ncbi:DMT family transporter [Rhodobium gokarnense]|uniref:Drug/metabolite transporter (DMT)-like permease n=1 Tax=Rhodobium gokarnense TaxID=364296 RepID=A0ABT3HCP3_9HYPH|nr:EamA family transporter [Rhodobium gokarnense]MCW2308104.1 drug/metabolite transporter (DMT)-like permease [Rhodobium gokarnense]